MILATRTGNREVRGTQVPGFWPLPTYVEWLGIMSSAGINVTMDKALAIPTVGAAIRLIAEAIGSLPLCVYEGEGAEKAKAEGSWQWRLLYESPNPDCSAFDFWSDVGASIETCGNAYARKVKLNGEILALYIEDPARISVKRDDRGRKIFKVRTGPTEFENLTPAQILHIRGFTPKGGDEGLSPIRQHADALGTALAAMQYQGRFFDNDATPLSYLSVPGRVTENQGKSMIATWRSTHGGSQNAGKLGLLTEGAELKSTSIPMRDAQFVEAQGFSAEQIAKIFLGPAASLLSADQQSTEEDSLRFFNFALRPRLRRIEMALKADPDLFPEQMTGGAELYPQFHIDEVLRADQATRSTVYHNFIQDGVLLRDEVRAEYGLPPLPNGAGKVPQMTPVGGAPNPADQPPPPPEE